MSSSPPSTLLSSISASVCYLAYFILDKTILLSDTLAAKDEEMRKLTFTIKFQSTLQDKITAVCILILFYFFDDFDFYFYLSLYFYFYLHTNFFLVTTIHPRSGARTREGEGQGVAVQELLLYCSKAPRGTQRL